MIPTMNVAQKKLTSNLLFGLGVLVIVIGVLIMIAGGTGAGLTFFVVGLLSALAAIVVGFIPARRN